MKNKNNKSIFTIQNIVLAGIASLLVGILLLAYNYSTRNSEPLQQKGTSLEVTSNSKGDNQEYTPIQLESIESAKLAATSYMEAIADCDYKKADSYKFLPSGNDNNAGKDCIGRCKEVGYEIIFNELKDYDDTQKDDDGKAILVATFSYGLKCKGAARYSPIEVLVSKSDNRWLVVKAVGPADVSDIL